MRRFARSFDGAEKPLVEDPSGTKDFSNSFRLLKDKKMILKQSEQAERIASATRA